MPTSTTRKPGGFYRSATARKVNATEKAEWEAMRKWELETMEEWDDLEKFRQLPKPKKLLGNEACHAVWPYASLLERQIKLHPLTKSIYVYYPQHSLTESGELLREIARQFSYEHLIPITFHNSQCYVETELLVEYSDNPWVVVNCLDGNSGILPIGESLIADISLKPFASAQAHQYACVTQGREALLEAVVAEANRLGNAAKQTPQLIAELHDRPLQNQYVRVDYQWFGETPEARAQHTVQWTREDASKRPTVTVPHVRIFDWMNVAGEAPVSPYMKDLLHKETSRLMKGKARLGGVAHLNSYHSSQRNLPTYSTMAGRGTQGR